METQPGEASAPRQEREERPERGERQRGGRGRGERPPRPERTPQTAPDESMLETTASAASVEAPAPVAVSQTNQAELPFSTRESAPAPVAVAPIPMPEPVAPKPAPALEAPKPASAPKLEPLNLEAAGLVMIETSRDKATPAPIVEEAPHAPRTPRPKPAWAQPSAGGSNEPLQQVETRNDA